LHGRGKEKPEGLKKNVLVRGHGRFRISKRDGRGKKKRNSREGEEKRFFLTSGTAALSLGRSD